MDSEIKCSREIPGLFSGIKLEARPKKSINEISRVRQRNYVVFGIAAGGKLCAWICTHMIGRDYTGR